MARHDQCRTRDGTDTVGRDIRQDGRLHIAQFTPLTTNKNLGAFRNGVLDVLNDLVGLPAVNQGSVCAVYISTEPFLKHTRQQDMAEGNDNLHALVKAGSDLELLDLFSQGSGKFVVDVGAVYQYTDWKGSKSRSPEDNSSCRLTGRRSCWLSGQLLSFCIIPDSRHSPSHKVEI